MFTKKNTLERLHPDLRTALDSFPPVTYDAAGIAMQRAGRDFMLSHPEYMATDEEVNIYDRVIKIEGNDALKLRIYEPANKTGIYPCFIWLHGGGMTIGFTESDDGQNIRFVKEAGCIVISVEYRLAPENPYPIPVNDCFRALKWISGHAKTLDIDVCRIGIGGLSGGGGLALATALRARDENGPSLCFILAATPMINRKLDSPSAMKDYHPNSLNRSGAQLLWNYYAGGQSSTPYMEPLLDDMHDMPPIYIAAGELDPFRDDAIALAQKCMAQEIPTELHIYEGFCHGGETLAPASSQSISVVDGYIRAIRDHLSIQ